MAVLSAADLKLWEENGYVVVPRAVPPENLQGVIDAVWQFLGMDPEDPDDWYREPHRKGGMVELYHHQSLWDNRQHPRVHQAFAEIWKTEKLWVSIDRANMKPPARLDKPEWDHPGMVHWDLDTSQQPIRFHVQGVLYLADTAADQGGFQCVPGFHNRFAEWVTTQPADRDPRRPDLESLARLGMRVEPIPGKAGDLLIWHSLLPHGNGRNTSDRPRLAQYISMYPHRQQDEEQRRYRIELWEKRLPPRGKAFPGDPWELEQRQGTTAELTPLGRKLLGLDRWK